MCNVKCSVCKQEFPKETCVPSHYKEGVCISYRCKRCKYANSIKSRYGITVDDYNAMLEFQGNSCFICSKHIDDYDKDVFDIDHCHDKGHVRGVLCGPCNRGLGLFKEDKDALLRSIMYLILTEDCSIHEGDYDE